MVTINERSGRVFGAQDSDNMFLREASDAWERTDKTVCVVWQAAEDCNGHITTVVIDPDDAEIFVLGPRAAPDGPVCCYKIDRSESGDLGAARASLCIGAIDTEEGTACVRLGALAILATRLLVPGLPIEVQNSAQRILSDPRLEAYLDCE